MIPQSIIDTSHIHPVLLYDGICIMCCQHVRFLIKKDTNEILRYASLQEATETQEKDYAIFLVDKGIVYSKSDVLVALNKKINFPFYIGMLSFVPRFMRNMGYDFISKVRYQIMGKNKTCMNDIEGKSHLFI